MKILEFPELRQTFEYDCGAQALQSVFVYYGIELREELIIKEAKTTEKGTSVENLLKAIENNGLKYDSKEMNIDDVKEYIDKNIPVILLIQAWTKEEKVNWQENWKDGHYVVAIGYDHEKIYFEDPYAFRRTSLSFKEIEERWHDIIEGNRYYHHGIAIHGKTPKYDSKRIIHMD